MSKKHERAPTPRDEGLQLIRDWRAWFVAAHAQRLRDNGVDEDTFTRDHATIVAQADAIAQRMTDDFLGRHP